MQVGPAWAQGAAQVIVLGVPPVLTAPYLADQEVAYAQGQYPLQFIYNEPTGRSTTFRFRVQVELDGQLLVDVQSNPVTVAPGIHRMTTFATPLGVTFPGGFAAIRSQLPGDVRQQINQTGRLPEGEYVYTVEAEADNAFGGVPSVPGSASFRVQLAEPPLLLGPVDGARLDQALPVFTWAPPQRVPVGTTVAYDLRIAEVLPGQTPYQALQANNPHVETTVSGQTTFVYTSAELPLERGAQYAWQITARDVLGRLPFTDDGRTDIYTFRRAGQAAEQIVWRYPRTDPIMEFEILDAEPVANGLRVDGEYEGLVDGQPMTATFDQVVLHPTLHTIIEGTVTLADGRPLENIIN